MKVNRADMVAAFQNRRDADIVMSDVFLKKSRAREVADILGFEPGGEVQVYYGTASHLDQERGKNTKYWGISLDDPSTGDNVFLLYYYHNKNEEGTTTLDREIRYRRNANLPAYSEGQPHRDALLGETKLIVFEDRVERRHSAPNEEFSSELPLTHDIGEIRATLCGFRDAIYSVVGRFLPEDARPATYQSQANAFRPSL